MTAHLNRRHALAGAAVAGLGVPLLAACSGEDPGTATDPTGTPSESPRETASETATEGAAALASTADIPEGGGVIFAEEEVVVTQPEAGEFRAFSSICTHQGCPVTDVTDTINCTCHGSRFSITDGSPLEGPASSPLGEKSITVEGDSIVLG